MGAALKILARKRKKKVQKKKVFVPLCIAEVEVEVDGRAYTHCGKHPMVRAHLFASAISFDSAEAVTGKRLASEHAC